MALAMLLPIAAQAEEGSGPCNNLSYGIHNQSKATIQVNANAGHGRLQSGQNQFNVNADSYYSVNVTSSTAYNVTLTINSIVTCAFMATPSGDGKSCAIQSSCNTPATGYIAALSSGIKREPLPAVKAVTALNITINAAENTQSPTATSPGLAVTIHQ